jgi:hypothetical protein
MSELKRMTDKDLKEGMGLFRGSEGCYDDPADFEDANQEWRMWASGNMDHVFAEVARLRAEVKALRIAGLTLCDQIKAEGGHGYRVHDLADALRAALAGEPKDA